MKVLVFIRLLPESVTQSDLRKFVRNALRPSWLNPFSSQSRIQATEIRKLCNRATLSVEYHGVVEIESAKAAVAAIHKLNRTSLKGKVVEVRKYFQRSLQRDRREGVPELLSANRRKQDRRREGMTVERVARSGPLEIGQVKTRRAPDISSGYSL